MTDQYDFYRRSLALGGGRQLTREQLESLGGITDEPRSGFYRKSLYKDGPHVPVAIWHDGARLWCIQGDQEKIAGDIWTFCAWWPIPEQMYRDAVEGKPWPDEPPAISKEHNLPPKTGDEIADEFLKRPITTQEQADQIAVWAKRVGMIFRKADDLFNVEKRPWLDGGQKVDDKWRWRKDCEGLGKTLKRALDGWLRELDRQEQERQRKAREEADRIRREADEAERRAAEAAVKAETQPGVASRFQAEAEAQADLLAQRAADAAKATQARPIYAGRTGAKASLRTYYVPEITDYDALLLAIKDEPEIRKAVQTVAERIARTKDAALPAGMVRKEEKRAA
jgi:hypothetical protein